MAYEIELEKKSLLKEIAKNTEKSSLVLEGILEELKRTNDLKEVELGIKSSDEYQEEKAKKKTRRR